MVTASVSFIDALIAEGVTAACDQDEQSVLLPERGTLFLISGNGLVGETRAQSYKCFALQQRQGTEQIRPNGNP
ncbi:MAG: hypothetical protein M3Q03_08495 [Chloroflexota bacterium]|nr:hypothetical protein [Chloroflexota bacterium]